MELRPIAPRPEDVPAMMDGLLECQRRMESTPLDAVVQAAVAAFGFVFVHPFEDGNGRIHRLLLHLVLSRNAFTPKGVIFPVSAVMLQRRHEYDFVTLCLQNDGRLSPAKRGRHFNRVTDKKGAALEKVVQRHMSGLRGSPGKEPPERSGERFRRTGPRRHGS